MIGYKYYPGTSETMYAGGLTLKSVKESADFHIFDEFKEGRKDIVIEKDGKPILRRKWVQDRFNPAYHEEGKQAEILDFGDLGYYDSWEEV